MTYTRLMPMSAGQTKLTESTFKARFDLNHRYVASLTAENLLRPYLLEAGLWGYSGSAGTTIGVATQDGPTTWHWGWESVTCELRGHILGHWMSAAARIVAQTGDGQLRAKLSHVVAELARCQAANGGEWAGSFPQSYLHRIVKGEYVWAPQYTLHKLFMGLLDVHAALGDTDALKIATRFTAWCSRWTQDFSNEQMDNILDWETGGMLETWATLYGVTGDPTHRELIRRYDRRRFFDRLLEGDDVLTNKHANTQIPEILGAARAYEVTGDERYRSVVEAFWRAAVTDRGSFVTGGSSNGEVWTSPFSLSARLQSPHEHCTVYNMMRLARTLHTWTGDAVYAAYWERNYVNAILAQQNPDTGMVTYFLPLGAGSTKTWGSPTNDFWCCHGTLMQAHAGVDDALVFTDAEGVVVAQYLPSITTLNVGDKSVTLTVAQDTQRGVAMGQKFSQAGHTAIQHVHNQPIPAHRPNAYVYDITVAALEPTRFPLKLRIPEWVNGEATVTVATEPPVTAAPGSVVTLVRGWAAQTVHVEFRTALVAVPLPDDPHAVAFVDGPLVLAALTDEDRALVGDPAAPATLLTPDRERHHGWWNAGTWRTVGQPVGTRFIPLNDVRDEPYAVYVRVG
ncbi:MAG TPA: beta-L-arabinofuranosidase domain-containing protein [Capsulimonadaceae bacterium]|jgi:hypothetical protein